MIFDKLTYASSGYERLRDIDVYDNKRISIYSVDLTLPISDGILKEIYGVDYILHLAAESHVDRSIEDPYPFLMSNVLGTHNMLWFARKLDSLKGFLNFSCYDGETRALTSNGFKSYNEIEVGDKVLSINPDTNEFEEKEVDDIIIQDYDGEMISFKGQRVDIKVTPNHRMYYKKGKNNQILIDEAQNIYNKTNLSLINGDWNGIKSDFTYIKNIGYVNTNDLFYLTGIFIGDGFLAPQTKEHKSKSGLTKKERDVSEKCRDSQTGRYISTKKIGNNDIILSKT
ncbi:MAG: GDP-mannose 4,6-dehydratase [bacterium]